MAAKPKLTPEEWDNARKVWESDPRKGFPWLIEQLDLSVSAEALRLRSKSEGWAKGGSNQKPSLDNQKSKLGEKKTKLVEKSVKSTAHKPKEESKRVPVAELIPVEEPRERGRPSLYRPEFDEQAYKLCLLGATDAEMADFFGVEERTINNWKIDHPNFFQSMQRGKLIADANVSEKLYHRAIGYSHEAEKIFNNGGEIVRAEYTEHYPPETAAIKLWLLNRRPKDWKDKIEVKEEININVFPPKEVLDGIYSKALQEASEREARLSGRRERLGIVIDHNDFDGD
jgi:hypothetical protein